MKKCLVFLLSFTGVHASALSIFGKPDGSEYSEDRFNPLAGVYGAGSQSEAPTSNGYVPPAPDSGDSLAPIPPAPTSNGSLAHNSICSPWWGSEAPEDLDVLKPINRNLGVNLPPDTPLSPKGATALPRFGLLILPVQGAERRSAYSGHQVTSPGSSVELASYILDGRIARFFLDSLKQENGQEETPFRERVNKLVIELKRTATPRNGSNHQVIDSFVSKVLTEYSYKLQFPTDESARASSMQSCFELRRSSV